MKKFLVLIIALLGELLAFDPATASVTFTGTAAIAIKDSSGANVTTGSQVIWIVDSNNSGDFGATTPGAIPANASLTVGSTFGGDLIVGSGPSSTFGSSNAGGFGTIDESLYAGRKFAVLWFPTLANPTSTAPNGARFGLVTDASWIVPSAAGAYGFASPINSGAGNPFLQIQAAGNAVYTIGAAPEPNRMMLMGLGLGAFFLRRRRMA